MMTSSELWSIWASIKLPDDFLTRKVDYSQVILEPPWDPWIRKYFWPVQSTPVENEEEQ